MASDLRMNQELDQFEVAFEQETALDRRRRQQLRQRAVARSKARQIHSTEKHGNIGFGVLRADVGRVIDREPGESKERFHISFGHAF